MQVFAEQKKLGPIGCDVRSFVSIDSTNTYLKREAMAGAPDGTVAVAEVQTAGRGRMDRTFQSPEGKGLYLSVLLRPALPPERLLPVTALAGVAVCNAVERVCGIRPGMKWPNDPVLGKKKLGGILTELVTDPVQGLAVVLGIGLNVLHGCEDFSPEVAELATSLWMEQGKVTDKTKLLEVLLEELNRMYAALKADDLEAYLAAYRRDCVNIGRRVRLVTEEDSETVMAVDVDSDFALVIRRADGRLESVRSGEVSVRGLYGYME